MSADQCTPVGSADQGDHDGGHSSDQGTHQRHLLTTVSAVHRGPGDVPLAPDGSDATGVREVLPSTAGHHSQGLAGKVQGSQVSIFQINLE